MNQQRLEIAINVMKRVRDNQYAFDMARWQNVDESEDIHTKEEDLHTCGITACFGGWLSLSQEWRGAGGTVLASSAQPVFQGRVGTWAIAEWLEIPFEDVSNLTHPNAFKRARGMEVDEEITVDHVIAALEDLRE